MAPVQYFTSVASWIQQQAASRQRASWLHNQHSMERLSRLRHHWRQLLVILSKQIHRRLLILLHRTVGSNKHRLQQPPSQNSNRQAICMEFHQRHTGSSTSLPQHQEPLQTSGSSSNIKRPHCRVQEVAQCTSSHRPATPSAHRKSSGLWRAPRQLSSLTPTARSNRVQQLSSSSKLPQPPALQQRQPQQPHHNRAPHWRNPLASSSRCMSAASQAAPRKPLILL